MTYRTTPEIRLIAGGQLHIFDEWRDDLIQLPIDQVVAFIAPDPPPPPHTPEQHQAIMIWNDRLQQLMAVMRERKRCQR